MTLRGSAGGGPADRPARFEKAARALGEARARNRSSPEGPGCPILVEGRRDREALRAMGFDGPIELVNRGWDRSRLVAHLHDRYGCRNEEDGRAALILLMDWDRTGGRLQRVLSDRLASLDVRIDGDLRRTLAVALKPEGRTVEGLKAHASELRPLIDVEDPTHGDPTEVV